MSRVLIASITDLCAADHGNDPQKIADWTANKTPEGLAEMMAQPGFSMFVAERGGQVAAVGATTGEGDIALIYVDPSARFQGASKALLAHMEADLRAKGYAQARLKATRTARPFYLAQGWAGSDAAQGGRFIDCFVMHKALNQR